MVRAEPRNWVAQPILQISTAPTLCAGELVPRHVDLRPFVLSGQDTYVTMGGLTRVALVEGSLVKNPDHRFKNVPQMIAALDDAFGSIDHLG